MKKQGLLPFWDKLVKEKCILLLWSFQEVNTLVKNGNLLKLNAKKIRFLQIYWRIAVIWDMSWSCIINLEILIKSYLGNMCCLFGLKIKQIIKDFLSLVTELLDMIIITQDYWPNKNLKKTMNLSIFLDLKLLEFLKQLLLHNP